MPGKREKGLEQLSKGTPSCKVSMGSRQGDWRSLSISWGEVVSKGQWCYNLGGSPIFSGPKVPLSGRCPAGTEAGMLPGHSSTQGVFCLLVGFEYPWSQLPRGKVGGLPSYQKKQGSPCHVVWGQAAFVTPTP